MDEGRGFETGFYAMRPFPATLPNFPIDFCLRLL